MKKLAVIFIIIASWTMAMAQGEAHHPNDPNFSKKSKSGLYIKYTITSKEGPYTVTVNGIKGETDNIKKLEIPETVNYRNLDFTVTVINKNAFSNISSLKSVTIPKTVNEIRDEAFRDCSELKSIKIGGVIEHCGENAFAGTAISKPIYTGKNLVYYPANMTDYKINEGTEAILEYAFGTCTQMTSILIPASVQKLYANSFENCNQLESIVVADGNKIFDSRNNCNAIVLTAENKIIKACKKSTIADGITNIGRTAFANTSIQKIDIPSTVSAIEDSAFFQSELTTITIPESVNKIGASAFVKCKKLAVVNFNASNCEGMEEKYPPFTQCQSLTSVNFGNKVSIVPSYSFMECTELRYVTLSNSIKEIGNKAFSGCKILSYLELTNSVETIGNLAFYETGISEPVHSEVLFAYYPYNYASEYSIPEGIKTIAPKAFREAGELKSLTIPNSVTKIEGFAFAECYEIENITMSNSIESIGYRAFMYCTKLKSIKLPNTIKTIDSEAFIGCEQLESIIIPNSINEIKDGTFSFSGLKYITLPKSISHISDSAFNKCKDLKKIYIPKGTMSKFKSMLKPEFHDKLQEK